MAGAGRKRYLPFLNVDKHPRVAKEQQLCYNKESKEHSGKDQPLTDDRGDRNHNV